MWAEWGRGRHRTLRALGTLLVAKAATGAVVKVVGKPTVKKAATVKVTK